MEHKSDRRGDSPASRWLQTCSLRPPPVHNPDRVKRRSAQMLPLADLSVTIFRERDRCRSLDSRSTLPSQPRGPSGPQLAPHNFSKSGRKLRIGERLTYLQTSRLGAWTWRILL